MATHVSTQPCYTVSPDAISDSDPCPCCGHITRSLSGDVAEHGVARAVYLVKWTVDHVAQFGARYEMIMGRWDDQAGHEDRWVIRFDYRNDGKEPGSIMIVDADDASVPLSFAACRMKRSDVIGKPLAAEVFAIYDAIVLNDARLAELCQG